MDYKNDYEIIYMIKENDDNARDLMFEKYMPIVKNIASNYYLNYLNKGADYEDFLQEGMLALNKAINSYDENGGSLFYTYASLCIKRHLITYCRNLCCQKHYNLNNSIRDDFSFLYNDFKCYVDDYIDEKIGQSEFIKIKNIFSIELSSVLELRYNGFCYWEISQLLDIPISVVDSRLSKIRKYLQRNREKIVY